MLQFFLAKFLRMSAVVLGATLIMFLLMHAIPGNPWSNYSESTRLLLRIEADEPVLNELTHRFGLDLPLWRQFTRYVFGDFNGNGTFFCGAICGNLGPSTAQRGRTVIDVLFAPPLGMTFWKSEFGYSLRLVLLGSIFTIGLGVPLGILSAIKPKSAVSRIISVAMAGLSAIPNFVLGLLAVIVAALWLRIIPVVPYWNNPYHWLIPAAVLAAIPTASVARVTRASLMNILTEDYVRTARAKGLVEVRVMLVHVLRNSLAPIITFLGPTLMEMFAGLVIIENLYGFPGIGREYFEAVLELDYPMIMGLTVFFSTGMIFTNFMVEIICAVLDPRVRSVKTKGLF